MLLRPLHIIAILIGFFVWVGVCGLSLLVIWMLQ